MLSMLAGETNLWKAQSHYVVICVCMSSCKTGPLVIPLVCVTWVCSCTIFGTISMAKFIPIMAHTLMALYLSAIWAQLCTQLPTCSTKYGTEHFDHFSQFFPIRQKGEEWFCAIFSSYIWSFAPMKTALWQPFVCKHSGALSFLADAMLQKKKIGWNSFVPLVVQSQLTDSSFVPFLAQVFVTVTLLQKSHASALIVYYTLMMYM